MSYDYLAKVGRDLPPLVEVCRGLEVKVQQKLNRQDYDAALRREWDDALKKAETKLRQFVTLKDRLDKQNGDDAAGMLTGAKVPKLNVPELEAELASLKERVGRQLTSLERLGSLESAIDKEQERVRVDELKEKQKEKEKEKEKHEQAEKEKQKEEALAAAAKAEAEAEAEKKAAEQAEQARKQQQQQREEEEERQKKIKADEEERKKEEEQETKEKEGKKAAGGGGHGDNLLNLIDSINDEVLSEILADDKQAGAAKPGRGRPPQQQKERRPRGERHSPRGEASSVAALAESSVVSPRRQPQPQPEPQEHVEPQLPVIDDEMEELRMRLKRLEEGEEMTSDKESELERVEKSLQDDFERGLARRSGGSSSSSSSEKGASPTLGTTQSGAAEEEATEEDSSYILHNDNEHNNDGEHDHTPRRKIPLDPITPRTKREFERQDKDEEEEADEIPEEKAGEREIKYLTLKKKPIPNKNKKKAQEEEEQKITFHEGEPPGYHRGGYLKRLERKAIVKHKWQTRWMRLDSQYLSVYGSAAEASKDKSGKLALQQYRLYDLEEVALARNIHGMEIAFKLRFNDRQVLLSASTKNLMAKWMLAIDSVAHRRNYNETETAFITKLSQRDVCLRRLYLPVTEDGIISCIVDDVEYKWRYRRDESSQVGELVSDDGTRAYTWDAEYLRPKSDSALDCGYGVWDGIWLTWYSADKRFVMRYQWHSAIEEFHFVSASPAIKTTFIEFPPFRYNGKVLLSSDRAFSWRVKGNKVPPPVVLSLQILYYQQNAKHK